MTLHLSDEPRLKAPLVLDYDGEAADPAAVAPVPDIGARAVQLASSLAPKPRSGFGRFALWVFGSLFGLVLSVSAWNFVTGLFATSSLLGWVAFALFAAALFVLLVLALRELLAFTRMARPHAVSARLA